MIRLTLDNYETGAHEEIEAGWVTITEDSGINYIRVFDADGKTNTTIFLDEWHEMVMEPVKAKYLKVIDVDSKYGLTGYALTYYAHAMPSRLVMFTSDEIYQNEIPLKAGLLLGVEAR